MTLACTRGVPESTSGECARQRRVRVASESQYVLACLSIWSWLMLE
eukprot:CAMPEP_0181451836 /NCGR_PEP_ID=MMETSP1110-20121109/28896_1 /TAXON_ID=174948 /ORGANISM="Symbiodinium sp., Strain CCMP421" /LENGTH=45 /DNA_ID= /DNA_START= /DNA_END= /DNA_ORIENTATION=